MYGIQLDFSLLAVSYSGDIIRLLSEPSTLT
nr:MAG TPA: hypothetical protein [Caudoviricetes sp.]